MPQHVVVRLADSLPPGQWAALTRARRGPLEPAAAEAIEAALDAHGGACHLRDAAVATVVVDALRACEPARYVLHAWVVMPNHVHLLWTPAPGWTLSALLHGFKSYTAHAANRLLGRAGAFWAPEYYDRAIRDDPHFQAVRAYIEANPVRAGLCLTPEAWRFGSAFERAHPTEREGGA